MLSKVVLLSKCQTFHFASEEAKIQRNGRTFPEGYMTVPGCIEQPVLASQVRYAASAQLQEGRE